MRDSDFSLIQAVLAGNAEAFGALVTRYPNMPDPLARARGSDCVTHEG